MNPRIRPIVWAFVGVLTALLVMGQAATLVGIYAQSHENEKTVKATEATAARIADCTEPTGECYQDGQKRTAHAVGILTESTQRIIAAALSCQADGVTEQQALIECIVKRTPK